MFPLLAAVLALSEPDVVPAAVGGLVLPDASVAADAPAAADASVAADAPAAAGRPAPFVAGTNPAPALSAPSAPALDPASDSGVPGDGATNVAAPVVTGTADPGNTVAIYAGGMLVGSGTASDGRYRVALSPLPEGTHYLSATAMDAAGNESAASGALSLLIDTQPPAAPALVRTEPSVSPSNATWPAIQSATTFTAVIAESHPGPWSIAIRPGIDPAAPVVRTLSGTGSRVNAVWDGKDAGGAFVPDGLYVAYLDCVDVAANAAAQRSVEIRVHSAPPAVVASGPIGVTESGVVPALAEVAMQPVASGLAAPERERTV